MMTINYNIFKKYAKVNDWLNCEIVNRKINKGYDMEKLSGWLIKNIGYEDGYDFTYEEALELKELVLASNNYRI